MSSTPTSTAGRRRTRGRRTRRLLPPTVLALVAALVLGACGNSDGGDDEDSTGGGQVAAEGAFPVTVEHKYGKTEIKTQPERVVTLGLSDQDAVLALGVKPVGAVDWFGERPFGKWPWAQPLWGDTKPEIVGERDEYNFEKIAALKPDLIIAQYSGMKKEQYETLSRLAPVVAQPLKYDDYAAPWQEMTRAIGRAMGQQARADELIAGVDKRFEQIRKEHPEFAGKTVAVVDPYEPGQYAVFAPYDPKVVFMTLMGFRVPDAITKAAGKEYAAEISSERLDLVDVDRLVFLTSDAAAEKRIKADKVYSRLAVARENRTLFVPYENPPIGGALSFSTVLSIPYALDQMLPRLTAGTG
jgi:iron complex transport system substrate-binding protein